MLPQDPPQGDTLPPPPPPSPAKKHNTPKGQNAHPSSSVASLLAQFQHSQHSQLRNVSPKNTLTKNTPVKDVPEKDTPKKDTPKKGEQMLAKKLLTLDKSAELPVKKQWTASPSSDWGSETDHDKADKSKKKKKRKKKEPKSEPTVATDLETEETEEQQENASGRGSGRQSCRYWRTTVRGVSSFSTTCWSGAAAATWGTWSPASQNPAQASSSSHSRHGG